MPKETITCGKCGNTRQIIRIKKEMLGKSFWCEVCRKTVDPESVLRNLRTNKVKGE